MCAVVGLGVVVLTAAGAIADWPPVLHTADGLEMRLDERGLVRSLKVDGREFLAPGKTGGIFLADVAEVEPRSRPMIGNPGFETLRDGKPVGWQFGPDWTVDSTDPHSGRYCMKLSVPGTEERGSSSLAAWVDVRPNTPYRVEMWLKTRGCAPHLYIEQYDASGRQRPSYPQICISHARYNSDWFKLGTDFTTAPFCRRIRVRTSLWKQNGTAWVDDFSVECIEDDYLPLQKPVKGRLVGGSPPQFEGRAEGVEVRWGFKAAPDHIAGHCEIEDLTGRDRAVSVAFRLPVNALGWTWHDDIHRSQRIEAGLRYGTCRLMGPRRLLSLYPFAAITGPEAGIAMGVPMDRPRAFLLGFQDEAGFFVTYEFGLTRDTTKFPGKAWFDFVIYRISPRWGFRDAAARYYRIFPRFFVKRVRRDGAAGFMADLDSIRDPAFNVPEYAIFDYRHRKALRDHRLEGVDLFSYTEFAGWWGWAVGIKPEEAKRKPSPEEAWAYIERLARGEIGTEGQQKVARCILNCNPYDRNGRRRLHSHYVPKWGGYNYLCNPDPEIEGPWGKVNRYTLTLEREVSRVDTWNLAGMYFDCVFAFSSVDNFRREHFRFADHPPAFDHISKKPVIPLDFSIYECAKALADKMHRRGKLVMANYSVTRHPTDIFCIQFIDVIGNEMLWTWCSDTKLALQRTLAGQKVVCMTWQEAKNGWPLERLERQMKEAMFYGTFYWLSRMRRDVYQRWHFLTRRIAAAGWQPVTFAVASDPDVGVERFGSLASHNLHFTVRNFSDREKEALIRFDWAGLGGRPAAKSMAWLLPGADEWKALGPAANGVKVTVPAGDTVVLRIGTAADVAADMLQLVPEWLLLAENFRQALRAEGAKVEAPDLGLLARRVEEMRARLTAPKADPERVRQVLRQLAARLAIAAVRGERTPSWRAKLMHYLALARHFVERAAEALGD